MGQILADKISGGSEQSIEITVELWNAHIAKARCTPQGLVLLVFVIEFLGQRVVYVMDFDQKVGQQHGEL